MLDLASLASIASFEVVRAKNHGPRATETKPFAQGILENSKPAIAWHLLSLAVAFWCDLSAMLLDLAGMFKASGHPAEQTLRRDEKHYSHNAHDEKHCSDNAQTFGGVLRLLVRLQIGV